MPGWRERSLVVSVRTVSLRSLLSIAVMCVANHSMLNSDTADAFRSIFRRCGDISNCSSSVVP
jgi:hypothetical protein